MMNIEFLRRLFTACSDESDSHYADGLNLSELYQRLDETVVAEDELIASLKAEFDADTSGRVDIAIYGYATACEQQGFINGARLALKLFDELTGKEARGVKRDKTTVSSFDLEKIVSRLVGCCAVLDIIHDAAGDNPIADAISGANDLLQSILKDIDGAEDYHGEEAQ